MNIDQIKTKTIPTASYEADPSQVSRVLLLYSGGLDTSVMLKWIQDEYEAEVVALTINLGQRDGMAEMVFTDTGCGMSDEVLENIFEPFFTRSKTGKGTGLGLSISHRIINQHRGEIEAVSGGPGQGSTFTVRLPLEAAEPTRDGSPSEPDAEPGAGDADWSARRRAA